MGTMKKEYLKKRFNYRVDALMIYITTYSSKFSTYISVLVSFI
jgi:hypothetical protein